MLAAWHPACHPAACGARLGRDRAMGPFASSRRVLERLVWSFWAGLWWDLARRMLGADIHPRTGGERGKEQRRWCKGAKGGPEKDPASSSSGQEGSPWGCWPSRCERPGKCWDMLQHLPVPISRTCLSSLGGWQKNRCRAEKLPEGHRSPPPPRAHLPVLAATHARRGGDAAGAQPRGHHHLLVPVGPGQPDPAGARDRGHLQAGKMGASPAPSLPSRGPRASPLQPPSNRLLKSGGKAGSKNSS